ncbi:MAG: Chloride channel core [Chthoniobacteraceae bacterium]|nr:Chloride channel core [Chthoniobacteraceae bacterium]
MATTSAPLSSSHPYLADFRISSRVLLLVLMAGFIGALSTVIAFGLVWLIHVLSNLAFFHRFSSAEVSVANHQLGASVMVLPVAGALIIGLMARFGSSKIRGHGIPEALETILLGQSRMQWKVAILKPLSSAISIGSGGPFGAEGPIIMTGGAAGSLFAQLFHLSSAERKTLLVAGAAAGMAAIFGTPIAAVLLAVELLLMEWRPRSLIPVAAAVIVAAVARVPFFGAEAMFAVTPHMQIAGVVVLWAVVVGVITGLVSGLVTQLIYALEDAFHRLPIHWMWWPAIGALFVGLGGLFNPKVLGVGYESIHGLLRGEFCVPAAVLGFLIAKTFVWAIALGSGTSGGVLAPLLAIGASIGVLLAPWMPCGDASLWALVAMGAMMGSTMRAPLCGLFFAVETTRDFTALPVLLAGGMAAYAVTVLLGKRSILTEKIARRGHHISCEYGVDVFDLTRVGEVMDNEPPTVPAHMTVAELGALIESGDPLICRRQGTLLVDENGRMTGIVTRGDLLGALQRESRGTDSLASISTANLIVTFADETLHEAITRMLHHDIGRLPVVDRSDPTRLVGYLGRACLLAARQRHFNEEQIRESGWKRS